jgi:glycogen operon protein
MSQRVPACHVRGDSGRPSQSINFITAHDGFTLYGLVPYGQKHNRANGHGDDDGSDRNFSWNCGWEGDDGLPPEVLALRKRQAKYLCCLLFLSNWIGVACRRMPTISAFRAMAPGDG